MRSADNIYKKLSQSLNPLCLFDFLFLFCQPGDVLFMSCALSIGASIPAGYPFLPALRLTQ